MLPRQEQPSRAERSTPPSLSRSLCALTSFALPGSDTHLKMAASSDLSFPLSYPPTITLSAKASADAKATALGVDLQGNLGVSGTMQAYVLFCNIPDLQGSLAVKLDVQGKKSWPVLIIVADLISSGAAEAVQNTVPKAVQSILGDMYLQARLSGSFSTSVNTIPQSPWLQWNQVNLGAGLSLEGGYELNELGVDLHAFVRGAGDEGVS